MNKAFSEKIIIITKLWRSERTPRIRVVRVASWVTLGRYKRGGKSEIWVIRYPKLTQVTPEQLEKENTPRNGYHGSSSSSSSSPGGIRNDEVCGCSAAQHKPFPSSPSSSSIPENWKLHQEARIRRTALHFRERRPLYCVVFFAEPFLQRCSAAAAATSSSENRCERLYSKKKVAGEEDHAP